MILATSLEGHTQPLCPGPSAFLHFMWGQCGKEGAGPGGSICPVACSQEAGFAESRRLGQGGLIAQSISIPGCLSLHGFLLGFLMQTLTDQRRPWEGRKEVRCALGSSAFLTRPWCLPVLSKHTLWTLSWEAGMPNCLCAQTVHLLYELVPKSPPRAAACSQGFCLAGVQTLPFESSPVLCCVFNPAPGPRKA